MAIYKQIAHIIRYLISFNIYKSLNHLVFILHLFV